MDMILNCARPAENLWMVYNEKETKNWEAFHDHGVE